MRHIVFAVACAAGVLVACFTFLQTLPPISNQVPGAVVAGSPPAASGARGGGE